MEIKVGLDSLVEFILRKPVCLFGWFLFCLLGCLFVCSFVGVLGVVCLFVCLLGCWGVCGGLREINF